VGEEEEEGGGEETHQQPGPTGPDYQANNHNADADEDDYSRHHQDTQVTPPGKPVRKF
jgi:hypothetical protein